MTTAEAHQNSKQHPLRPAHAATLARLVVMDWRVHFIKSRKAITFASIVASVALLL